jgi:ribosomal protein S12 methylthiotransferase accessory factor
MSRAGHLLPRAPTRYDLSAALPRALRRACSPYTGIVRSLEECLAPSSEPPLFRVACAVGRGRGLIGSPLHHLSGIGGTGRSRQEAVAAAVGEALERYSASYVPHERLVHASAAELGAEAVCPQRFALFSDRQYEADGFPFERFTRDLRVPWVRGWSIRDGRAVWLPAELVYLGDAVSDGARRIGYATSSGAACADSTGEALVRGLCELLERDAFMIVWANRLSLPLIDVSRHERLRALEQDLFARTGLCYSAVDMSCVHGLPSVLAVVRAPADVAGALGVGAGTAPSLERAWWKALAEAFSARAAGAKLALLACEPPHRPEEIRSFEDHIRYYADHTAAGAAAYLDASPERVDAGSIPRLEGETAAEQVAALSDRLRSAGSSGYAVDTTAPDVRALGLSVVKAVVPELCPLDVAHTARHLGGRRLYEAPVTLGLRAEPLDEDHLNPEPHPFP